MSSLASTASPSSFQLRWGLLCRKYTPVLLSVRFRALSRNRRLEVVRAEGGEVSVGDGGELSRSQPKPDPSSMVDKFAGWLGEDSDGESSQGGGRFGGIAGVALAGLFLVGGLAFASISLSTRRCSGFRPQMQPLTVELETSLPADTESGELLFQESSSERTVENNFSVSTSGINNKHRSSPESIEPAPSMLNGNTINTSSIGPKPELIGAVVEVSDDVDVIDNIDNDVSSKISCPNSDMNELSLQKPDGAFSSKDAKGQTTLDDLDSAVHFIENEDMDPVILSASTDEPTDFGIDCQDENFVSDELDDSQNFNNTSSQLSRDALGSGNLCTIVPNLTLDTQETNENLEISKVDSGEPNIRPGEDFPALDDVSMISMLGDNSTTSIPSGTISASALDQTEEHKHLEGIVNSTLKENTYSHGELLEAQSSSAYTSHYINDSGFDSFDQQDELSRSIPTSASLLPESSFSHAGIPAPSVVSPALQVQLGKVVIPAVVDQAQGQALAALQVLKVVEIDVQPGDICTRREYARWLVLASSALSRSAASKVYPAMYIENATELAFDDITPEDTDFPYIQGLAEAGLIASKLSRLDNLNPNPEIQDASIYFSPESPLSRQDLVSWKMALEKRVLPEVDRKILHELSGYIDVDKINPDAWPAIVSDISAGENSIISLAFGYTRLFQPEKPVTKAQAAIALSIGDAAEVVGEELARIEAESLAETAVLDHAALVAEVEKDLNVSFERELGIEREKIEAMEKLAQDAKLELEKLRSEMEEESNTLEKERTTVESELEILSRLRNDVEEQLQNLLSNKMEIAFEHDRVNKLRSEAERENTAISQLKYELEVERKALAMARAWAEDEAKKAREQAKALEEARDRWEKHGIKVIVDEELRESASAGVTWQISEKQVTIGEVASEPETMAQKIKSRPQHLVEGLNARAEQLVANLRALLEKTKGKSAAVIEGLIQKIRTVIATLKQHATEARAHVIATKQRTSDRVIEVKDNLTSRASTSMQEFKDNASEFSSGVRECTRRAVEEFRESVDKITQRFKT